MAEEVTQVAVRLRVNALAGGLSMKREKGSLVRIAALVNLGSVEEVGFLFEGWRDLGVTGK